MNTMLEKKQNVNQQLEVRETAERGKSLFTTKDIGKDDTVLVMYGPVVTAGTIYTIPTDDGLYIDPVPVGNFAQYLCHSCDPNCGIRNRTEVVTIRDIWAGEEVTIDYAMIVLRYGAEMTPERHVCQCGSARCRGKLGAYKELPKEIRERYKGYISDYLTRKDTDLKSQNKA